MKTTLNKKFEEEHISMWQKCADKKDRAIPPSKGNLTRWMMEVLNKQAEKELKDIKKE